MSRVVFPVYLEMLPPLGVLLLTYHVGRVLMNGAACSSVICSKHETEPALCMQRFQNERSVNYKNIAALSALPRQKTDNSSTSESQERPKLASVLIFSKHSFSDILCIISDVAFY